MRRTLLMICFIGLGTFASAQGDIWQQLAKITYKKEYNEIMGFKVDVPVFAEDVKKARRTGNHH